MTNTRLLPIVQEFNLNVREVNNLVLLDRDGTLNRDLGYTYKLSDLVVLPINIEFIKSLVNKESSVICITNQSGIGRGYFSIDEAKKFNQALHKKLSEYGLHIEVFYICPHIPDLKCACRKPGTLMLEMALQRSTIPIEKTVFFGDSITDQIACMKLDIKYIQVNANNE